MASKKTRILRKNVTGKNEEKGYDKFSKLLKIANLIGAAYYIKNPGSVQTETPSKTSNKINLEFASDAIPVNFSLAD